LKVESKENGDLHSPNGALIWFNQFNMMFHHGKIMGIMWHKNPGIGLGHLAVSGGTVWDLSINE